MSTLLDRAQIIYYTGIGMSVLLGAVAGCKLASEVVENDKVTPLHSFCMGATLSTLFLPIALVVGFCVGLGWPVTLPTAFYCYWKSRCAHKKLIK